MAGSSINHIYSEGVFTVRIVAHSITGATTEISKSLTVTFRAPESLDFTIIPSAVNNATINIAATALYETMFQVYFGDVVNEIPSLFLEGDTINHTYTALGTYSVKVVALSGGVATTQLIKSYTVTPTKPILALPIDFESTVIPYTFTNFDGGMASVVANPSATGVDVSANVGKMVKGAGQTWGGTYLTMPAPIDFSTKKTFKMKVYSPRVGARVLFKVENLTNGAVSYEKEMTSTVANAWETLTFDYSAIDLTKSYQKITLIWDNGTAGNGTANYTFYFDDISLN